MRSGASSVAKSEPSSSTIKIVPEREKTAMTVSLWRAEENVPEKRRPSCLSMTSVKATARQPRLARLLLGMMRRPTQHDRVALPRPGAAQVGDRGLDRSRRRKGHQHDDPGIVRPGGFSGDVPSPGSSRGPLRKRAPEGVAPHILSGD